MKTILALLALAVIVTAANGLRCYQCSYNSVTSSSKSCKNADGLQSKTCSGTCYKDLYNVGKISYVARGCAAGKCTTSDSYQIPDIGLGNRYCCSQDNCNGSALTVASVLVTVTLAFFAVGNM